MGPAPWGMMLSPPLKSQMQKNRDRPVGSWFQCVQKGRPWREVMGLSDVEDRILIALRISSSTEGRGRHLQFCSGHLIGNFFYWALMRDSGAYGHLAVIPTSIPFISWKIKAFAVGHPSLDGSEATRGNSLRLQFLRVHLGGDREGQMRNRILTCPSYSAV